MWHFFSAKLSFYLLNMIRSIAFVGVFFLIQFIIWSAKLDNRILYYVHISDVDHFNPNLVCKWQTLTCVYFIESIHFMVALQYGEFQHLKLCLRCICEIQSSIVATCIRICYWSICNIQVRKCASQMEIFLIQSVTYRWFSFHHRRMHPFRIIFLSDSSRMSQCFLFGAGALSGDPIRS